MELNPRKRARSTARQTEALVDMMEAHRDLALGRFIGPMGHENNENLWAQVAAELSDFGPPKSSAQTKTTWRDLKRKVRTKNALINQLRNTTGNIQPIPMLTEIEKKVLNIIGPESSEGLGEQESGLEGEYVLLSEAVAPAEPLPVLLPEAVRPTVPLPVLLPEAVAPAEPLNLVGDVFASISSVLPSTSSARQTHPPPKRSEMDDVAKRYGDLQAETNKTLKEINSTLKEYYNKKIKLMEERNQIEKERNALQQLKLNMLQNKENREKP